MVSISNGFVTLQYCQDVVYYLYILRITDKKAV